MQSIFKLRGNNYLRDKKKIPAQPPQFELDFVELLASDEPVYHVSRYLKSVRCRGLGGWGYKGCTFRAEVVELHVFGGELVDSWGGHVGRELERWVDGWLIDYG